MRRTLQRLLHPAPAAFAVALMLSLTVAAAPAPAALETAGSVVAKAAQADGSPGGDQRYPVGGPAMETARAIALAHWGATPCGGVYTISWTPLDFGTNATASWRNPTDAWNNPQENFDCRIDMNPQADYDFAKLCTVLTHEIGHLLGRAHDPSEGHLMSAYYTSSLPECEGREPAGMAEQAAAPPADSVDIVTSQAPRRTLRKTQRKARTKLVKRCVVRKSKTTGKRIKTCRMVRVKVKAAKTTRKKPLKASGAKKRTSRVRATAR